VITDEHNGRRPIVSSITGFIAIDIDEFQLAIIILQVLVVVSYESQKTMGIKVI